VSSKRLPLNQFVVKCELSFVVSRDTDNGKKLFYQEKNWKSFGGKKVL
jgi:hypothetical protein